ncbi:MAG TPA: gamma-glutamyl-gamma-aminobutyrate hydrolase family protein [Syntrophomonadaceae bacterium]|nr:gamma-glutamyl-gamma-aminobutyrate hydrolase family protein [Syntrophomonadaceae bacterium]HNX29810.1 gamma-glutamyl-gamma-aminobutyrate hydrolase family protein [Syntrophomonadaceae bacterium]HPR94496.1 gamma-glutamyl-gamma-aminobutyrate hydrolase family protein [Syntrophomonadaceae bacterium]
MRPIIGITGNYDLEENLHFLAEAYVTSINKAGAAAIMIPPEEARLDDYTKICHGIILSGGGDIDPVYFNEAPSWTLGNINPLRDWFEIKLARKCLAMGVPLLGICRGCQVINVAAGGSLIQDIRSRMSHQQKAPRDYAFHDIFIDEETYLFQILRKNSIRVNSFHHQAIRKAGEQLKISARAEENIIEAVEKNDHPFAIGVQWHPECMNDENSTRLFKAFTEQATVYQHKLDSKMYAYRTNSRLKS